MLQVNGLIHILEYRNAHLALFDGRTNIVDMVIAKYDGLIACMRVNFEVVN